MVSPGEAGPPYWAKWTRRVLTEDSGSMPLLINIYQLIIRHPDLFYPTRELFIPHIVASLGKLTLGAAGTAADGRIITLDVIELILKWEKKRIELAKVDEARMEVDAPAEPEAMQVERSPKRSRPDRAPSVAPSIASTGVGGTYNVPSNLRDQVINNLLRFIANSAEPLTRNVLVGRALGLLKELIGPVWSDLNVKLTFFQRTFATNEVADDTLILLCNSAEVLNVVASFKPPQWWQSNLGTLHMIIEKGFSSSEFRLHAALRQVMERLFEVIPSTVVATPEDAVVDATKDKDAAQAFVDWASSTITEGLRALGLRAVANVPPTMMILQAWAKAAPERVDPFIPLLVRVFSRCTKDHISQGPVNSGDPHLRLLVSSLEVLRQRVSYLGEQRRWFLSAIVQLVEKSSNLDVCRFLLQMTRKWITEKDEVFPTQKEKAGILLKMMLFETRNSETLQKDYLALILDIYTDPALTRTELTVKLEPAFLIGCKMRDPTIRSKFLAALDRSLATGLFSRLHFILGVQSWDSLGDTYWIHQALDLLLGAVDTDEPLFVNSSVPVAGTNPTFIAQLEAFNSGHLLSQARKLLYADPTATHAFWVSTFKASWSCLNRREQLDLSRFLIGLLVKEYHIKSIDRRPNPVQTILAGTLACSPSPSLPPHLVRYLAKTFNAWHIGIELLQEAVETPREEESIRESTQDALAEIYSELSEDDLLYGLWRRRAGYNETNAAIRLVSRLSFCPRSVLFWPNGYIPTVGSRSDSGVRLKCCTSRPR